MDLKGKTLLITGASRGIGLAIGLRAARDGANVAIAAKTTEPHPKLPGTIFTAADEIGKAGGKALPVVCDIRDEHQVKEAVAKTVEAFGGLDVLVNNASAIDIRSTPHLPVKKWDLMHSVNARGTWVCSKYALPHLLKSANPHILTVSPPLNVAPDWFGRHVAYTLAKYGMTLVSLGLSEELRDDGVAVNTLWPRTVIATAAVQNLLGGDEVMAHARRPEIVADAAYAILTKESRACTGNFFVDEDLLRAEGVTDFEPYAVTPGAELYPDFFV
jgi:citronellol/citronellal dehydrogenase